MNHGVLAMVDLSGFNQRVAKMSSFEIAYCIARIHFNNKRYSEARDALDSFFDINNCKNFQNHTGNLFYKAAKLYLSSADNGLSHANRLSRMNAYNSYSKDRIVYELYGHLPAHRQCQSHIRSSLAVIIGEVSGVSRRGQAGVLARRTAI